jgi:hypothetical protein
MYVGLSTSALSFHAIHPTYPHVSRVNPGDLDLEIPMMKRVARSIGALRLSLAAVLIVILGLGLGGLLFATRIAHAASFSVSDCSTYGTSSQAGTLAKALADATASADSSDTITFACDTSGAGLVFPSAYAVTKSLTLDGTGHSVTLNGNDTTRFFTVSATGKLTLIHLMLTHGFGDTPGGAIQVNGGSLIITNSTLSDNVDNDPTSFVLRGGGAIAVLGGSLNIAGSTFTHNQVLQFRNGEFSPISQGGAILLQGTAATPCVATIGASTFSDNSAVGGMPGGWGGAIYAQSADPNSAPRDAMKLSVTGSTFTHNLGSEALGGALGAVNATVSVSASVFSENQPAFANDSVIGGAIGVYSSDLSITTSTFTHNPFTAVYVGPSSTTLITQSAFIENASLNTGGGALSLNGANTGAQTASVGTIADTTFTGNSAIASGGISEPENGGGAIFNSGVLTLSNDTFAGNSVGGSFHGSNINDSGKVVYRNTIVANGTGDANCFYASSSVATDGGYNLDSGTSCGFSSANHSLTNTDPKLGALADNGGPTQTMALGVGSPAIDAANNSVCAAAPVSGIDQRGVARPQGPACDIGAFELVPTATTTTTITASAGEVACGQKVTFTAHVTSASGTPTGSVTFKDGSTAIGTSALSGGYAFFSTTTLKTGTHSVSAVYPAGHGFLGSASGAVTVIVGACEGPGGSGIDPNAPTTSHPLFETPTPTLAPASTATTVSAAGAADGPPMMALVGSGALLVLLLASGGFFYLRRRNGGTT